MASAIVGSAVGRCRRDRTSPRQIADSRRQSQRAVAVGARHRSYEMRERSTGALLGPVDNRRVGDIAYGRSKRLRGGHSLTSGLGAGCAAAPRASAYAEPPCSPGFGAARWRPSTWSRTARCERRADASFGRPRSTSYRRLLARRRTDMCRAGWRPTGRGIDLLVLTRGATPPPIWYRQDRDLRECCHARLFAFVR